MITDVNKLDDLSYILYYKSMNGLKNCIDLSHAANKLCSDIFNSENINLLNERQRLENYNREFQSYAIDTIVYFQAMIEADLNKWVKKYNIAGGSFPQKWENVQKYFNIQSDYFNEWDKVYKQYRVTFLHADEKKIEKNIKKFNDLSIYELYDSIKNGWFAYIEILYHTLNYDITDISLEENWEQNKINQQIDDLKDNLNSFNQISEKLVSKILKELKNLNKEDYNE
ncbi:MAG: hypothetical protein WC279_11365 [Sulfurimonas sp.]|jgi:hypothetical protein|uniref:hypothetical protein n=1 Tax=unclassified Sulfurimonas TaxID=2623549 RepID=UPI0008B9F7DD|nr:hypothetical protein [Sulfurimonas sp. RIFOXYB12_FULL_35_9]MBS4069450.1 hypothetical protein [Sulfurimonas sp.]OHE04165.1 MAG: hypothetical protein A2345_08665 [Sulfurimonas sp. RIFOXYB12_FULL_35_9]OHE19454.1 MAG: hypothetical protein A2525_03550 [Sulfurimonas sp. RIFOXYD12_FULL_36_11]OHE21647.1 MAG: hypothetical protein A2540_07885 [Sulfurimonas sp. RIFOXYD2_FULL_37_8]